MLSEKDLQKIGIEVGRVIEQNVTPTLDALRTDVDGLRSDVDGLRSDVDGLRSDVDGLTTNVDGLRNQMVTKDYLDDKLADLKGFFVQNIRIEDNKVNHLISIHEKKKHLNKKEVGELKKFQIFPK
jgi:uncharacterized protein YoxC